MYSTYAPFVILAVILISFILLVFGITGIGNTVRVDVDIASFEQLRMDYNKNPNNMVANRVVGANMQLAEDKRINKIPIIEWIIPDRWANEKFIEMK
jgi:hypothetical protein